MENNQIIIVGGGLAGLTAAIHLSKIGYSILVIEKNDYPKHKVCGEYVSNEIVPYFNWLAIDIKELQPTNITKFVFSTSTGKSIKTNLPLGGFGISRYALDCLLYKKALSVGCTILQDTVEDIAFEDDKFTVTTLNSGVFQSNIVIGAFGKRSNIDQKMQRKFIQQKSSWLAVKGHYKGSFPDDLVGLYNFKGGYCGVSKVENDTINICYLTDYKTFKGYKNIEEYQKSIICQNPNLKNILEQVTPVFDKPLTISQISFENKQAVENHILMIGDTAGLIHPLCGNGMAMAVHSAKIVSELVQQYLENKLSSRKELEEKYVQAWNFNFKRRLQMGRFLVSVFQKHKLSEKLMYILIVCPFLLPLVIKKTHGNTITLN